MPSDDLLTTLEPLHDAALGWAVSCCAGDWHRGEDVLQLAYTRTVSGQAAYHGRSSLRTWWFGVIRIIALEEGRKQGRFWGLLERLRDEVPAPCEEESESEPCPREAQVTALVAALARLSSRQREVLHLVFYQKLTIQDASDVLHISVGSARQHYERGKARLRELLAATTDHDAQACPSLAR